MDARGVALWVGHGGNGRTASRIVPAVQSKADNSVLISGVRRASGAVLAPHTCTACVTGRRGRSKTANHEMYAMQSTELIRQFLHERVGTQPDQVVNDALLADLGVDSLMLAELMFEAEDRLGISIDSNVTVPKTVGDMVRLIDNLRAVKAAKAAQS